MNKIITGLFLITSFFSFSIAPIFAAADDVSHPFLLITPSMYTEVQNRANTQPWSDMKADAINECQNHTHVYQFGSLQFEMADIIGSCTLAYLVDTSNQTAHYNRLKSLLLLWPQIDADQESPTWDAYWERFTPQASAFHESTLALDVIRDQMKSQNPQDLATIETAMQSVYQRYKDLPVGAGWIPTREGLTALWELYTDDYSEFLISKDQFKQILKTQMSDDGVFYEGAGYAYNRLGTDWRPAKHAIIDVLEFTGEDNTYYNDPKITNFYEWFYGYSSTTFNIHHSFGDSAAFGGFRINDNQASQSFPLIRAMKFSPEAGAYASQKSEGLTPRGRFMNYMLLDQQLPAPSNAPSRIFNDGGAYFREPNADTESLQAALWNVTGFDWHSHKDTNAVFFAGYGEPLLLNAGFAGASGDYQGFAWDYLNNRAVSSNVALIDYQVGTETNPSTTNDHLTKFGNGVTEGFTSQGIDYASADSGAALPNGHHQRDMLFIQPKTEADGYMVLFDQIQASSSASIANLAIHPNSDSINTVVPNQEYHVEIGHFAGGTFTENNVNMTMLLATQPDTVTQYDGAIADWATVVAPPNPGPRIGGYVGKYLFNGYSTDSNGYKQILTLFYPYDDNHARPTISPLTQAQASGVSIAHSISTTDYIWENHSGVAISEANISQDAINALYRLTDGLTQSVYLKQATSYQNTFQPDLGITSDNPVTIHLYNNAGHIITDKTSSITLSYPDIIEVTIDGQPVTPTNQTTDSIQFTLTAGTYEIAFTAPTLIPSPTPQITPTATPTVTNTPTPTAVPTTSPTQTPTPTPTNSNPYLVRIEAEDFYASSGDISVVYTGDQGPGQQKVNLIQPGQWTEYSFDASETGTYKFTSRSSSANASATKTFDVLIDGQYQRTFNLPYTQYWEEFADHTETGIYLTAGSHILRINYTGTAYDFNYIEVEFTPGVTPSPSPTVTQTPTPTATAAPTNTPTPSPTAAPTNTPTPTPTTVPGGPIRIEAENFTNSSGNISVVYTGDDRPNNKINLIQPGQWTEYSVNIPTTGYYTFLTRSSSANNTISKTLDLLIDGQYETTVTLPFTQYWEEFFDTNYTGMYLTAGTHTIRINFTASMYDVNYFEVIPE